MSLQLPTVGTQPGPQFATDLNASLTILDAHDHTSGNGVPVPTAGLNIDATLSLNDFGLENVGQLEMTVQPSPLSGATFPGTIYVSGDDLYYNDGNGNQIQITSSGQVNTATGNITGLVPPAAATYLAGPQTFEWRSNTGTNVAANLDAASIIIREQTPSANGITLASPLALAAPYTLTLPTTLPGTDNALTLLDSSGTITTLDKGGADEILKMDSAGNNLEYLAVGSADRVLKVNAAGTGIEYGLVGDNSRASTNTFAGDLADNNTISTTFFGLSGGMNVTNPFGRLVAVHVIGRLGAGADPVMRAEVLPGFDEAFVIWEVRRNGVAIQRFQQGGIGTFNTTVIDDFPPGLVIYDAPGPGNHVYTLWVRNALATSRAVWFGLRLFGVLS